MFQGNKARLNKRVIIIGVIGLIGISAMVSLIVMYNNRHLETYSNINDHLMADGVKLYLEEDQLVRLLGKGEYEEGFGGHGRKYDHLQLRVGFAGDSDNDFYGKVSSIEFTNPQYSIFGIRIGDSTERSVKLLLERGYKPLVDQLYRNGEYVIALQGQDKVEMLQLWFDDKDLRDRNY